MNASIIGRTEAVDSNAMRRLTEKRRQPEGQPTKAATAAAKSRHQCRDEERRTGPGR